MSPMVINGSPYPLLIAFLDYIPVISMLEFDENRTSATVNVPIINDGIREDDELFLVTLALVQGEEEEVPPVVLEPAFAGVIIADDDCELKNPKCDSPMYLLITIFV